MGTHTSVKNAKLKGAGQEDFTESRESAFRVLKEAESFFQKLKATLC